MKLISSTSRFGGFGENFLLKISERDAGGCGVGWGLGEELEAGRGQRHTVDSGGIQNFNEKKRDIYLPLHPNRRLSSRPL